MGKPGSFFFLMYNLQGGGSPLPPGVSQEPNTAPGLVAGHLPTEPSCQPKSRFLKDSLCHMSIEFSSKPSAPQGGYNPEFLVAIGS